MSKILFRQMKNNFVLGLALVVLLCFPVDMAIAREDIIGSNKWTLISEGSRRIQKEQYLKKISEKNPDGSSRFLSYEVEATGNTLEEAIDVADFWPNTNSQA